MNFNTIPYQIQPSEAFKKLTTNIQTNIMLTSELMKINLNLQTLLNDKKKEYEMLEKKNKELQNIIHEKQKYIDDCIDSLFEYEMKLHELEKKELLLLEKKI